MHLLMTSLSLGTKPLRAARRVVLERRVRWIVTATITYNVIEAVVAITAGRIASSAALVAFGLDSVVEVLSAAAVAWQFAAPDPHRRERTAMRLIAVAFFGLALFVTVDAVRTLLGANEPDHSTVGIVLAAVSLVIMPFLSWFERRTGRELGSASAVADSKQTLLCTYLSAVLLVGLVLNSTLGWSWADPLAALVIAGVAIKEGIEAWRGDACCTPVGALLSHDDEDDDCTDDCCTPETKWSPQNRAFPGVAEPPSATPNNRPFVERPLGRFSTRRVSAPRAGASEYQSP
jgi:Co/Zn/Cd efflux system component